MTLFPKNVSKYQTSDGGHSFLPRGISLTEKLRDLHKNTIRGINSTTVSLVRNGQAVEDAEQTMSERLRKIHSVNLRRALPEGVRIEIDETTGLALLYYLNEKYDPEKDYD